MLTRSTQVAVVIAATAFLYSEQPVQAQVKYETNKFELKSKVEQGGWVVAWADDITETDAARGVVAGGVSVVAANPAPFLAWVERLVNQTITSFEKSARRNFPPAIRAEVKSLAAATIKDAVKGKNPRETVRRYGTIDFKAGAIKYSGRNYVKVRNPITGKTSEQTVSRTWGMKPYIAFRWRTDTTQR